MAIAALVFAGSLTANAAVPTTSTSLVAASTVTLVQDDIAQEVDNRTWHQKLKERFIQGGPGFMGIVLVCLILGLAMAIERIIFLNLSTTDTQKLAEGVEEALKSGGVEAAKEVCRNTKGPVASIYYQGLERADESIEAAEKAVVAYGGVQMGQLEKNVSWVSLFIALAPMLGFMGTVIGMITAFDKIEAAGDMNPSLVAGGNWCPDCRILDGTLQLPTIKKFMEEEYQIMHIDVGRYDKNMDLISYFGIPKDKGVPRVMVFDKNKVILNKKSTKEWTTARDRGKQEVFNYFQDLAK